MKQVMLITCIQQISIAATDANPNVAGVQVVDKAADTESGRNATIEFDVTLTVPEE